MNQCKNTRVYITWHSLKWRMRFTAVKSTVLVFAKYHRNCKLLLGEQEIQSVEGDGHLGHGRVRGGGVRGS